MKHILVKQNKPMFPAQTLVEKKWYSTNLITLFTT